MYCDFCGKKDPVYLYPCGDFSYMIVDCNKKESFKFSMFRDWLSCDDCYSAIERNDFDYIKEKLGLTKGKKSYGIITNLFNLFTSYRKGEAKKIV